MHRDPVCGMQVVSPDAPRVRHDRRDFRFCSPAHAEAFANDPDAYLNGSIVVDPVCGMRVATASAPARMEHAGRTYWFDSEECYMKFHRSPDTYVAPPDVA